MMAASRCLIANAKYDMRCVTTGNDGLNLKYWKADKVNCHIKTSSFLTLSYVLGYIILLDKNEKP